MSRALRAYGLIARARPHVQSLSLWPSPLVRTTFQPSLRRQAISTLLQRQFHASRVVLSSEEAQSVQNEQSGDVLSSEEAQSVQSEQSGDVLSSEEAQSVQNEQPGVVLSSEEAQHVQNEQSGEVLSYEEAEDAEPVPSEQPGVVLSSDEAQPVQNEQSDGPATTFQELVEQDALHSAIASNLSHMKISSMTEVQSLTIHEALKGVDVLAQAKTGTGKTLAFLTPIVQRLLSEDPSLATAGRTSHKSPIRAIIISPTRELAEQIAVEAEKLVRHTGLSVQRAVGGTQKARHLQQMQRSGCHLLVGTPGRLKDILSDPLADLSTDHVNTLVLDEADRLLDDGFWPDVSHIEQVCLQKREIVDRQTLMFSATISREVAAVARKVLKPDTHFVQTVQGDDLPTHERIPQHLIAVPGMEHILPAVVELCSREIVSAKCANKDFKAILYFSSSAETKLAAFVLSEICRTTMENPLGRIPIFSIDGRLTQAARTENSTKFRSAKSGILVSTDVTARGLDFPGVTHVIQVGLPQEMDTYVHRLGRTGRAGAPGQGYLIMHSYLLNEGRKRFGNIPIKRDNSLETSQVNNDEPDAQRVTVENQYFQAVRNAAKAAGFKLQTQAYAAALHQCQLWKDKAGFVEALNRRANLEWGLSEPPQIPQKAVRGAGLVGVQGIRIGSDRPRDERPSRQQSGRDSGERRFGSRDFGGERRFGGRDFGGERRFGGRDSGAERRFGGRDSGADRRFGDRRSDGGGFRRGGDDRRGSSFSSRYD